MNISENMEVRLAIEDEIHLLGQDFKRNKALILTERDLQCQLHRRLSEVCLLRGNFPTAEPTVTGPCVHADLSWFDKHGKLSILPDLSIIEVDKLSIFRSVAGYPLYPQLPSKQYSFAGSAIILEIKFCRWRPGITDAFVRTIKKDIDKIERLISKRAKEGLPNSLFCYFVIFSKSDDRSTMFRELEKRGTGSAHCKLIYEHAAMNYTGVPTSLISGQVDKTKRDACLDT